MAERNQQSDATDNEARPIDEAELDKVAGGKRSEVKDAHDKYANTGDPYAKP